MLKIKSINWVGVATEPTVVVVVVDREGLVGLNVAQKRVANVAGAGAGSDCKDAPASGENEDALSAKASAERGS